MKRIFINKNGVLRFGWKMFLVFFFWIILKSFPMGVLVAADKNKDALMYGVSGGLYIFSGFILMWLMGKIDKRNWKDFGFIIDKKWWKDFVVGLIFGFLILLVISVFGKIMGWVEISSFMKTNYNSPLWLTGLGILLVYIGIAINEEFVFRVYPIKNLRVSNLITIKSVFTLIVSSVLFSIIHMVNPGANWLGFINIFLAGILLGWGYLATGKLALPIGLHLAWNFCEEFVFGFSINGQPPAGWLMGSSVNGPKIWMGGEFGPDGGLITTLMIIVEMILIWWWAKKSKQFRR